MKKTAIAKNLGGALLTVWLGLSVGAGDARAQNAARGVTGSATGIAANPEVAEAKTTLFYAWNEVDEGGWLVPDKGQGTAKLDAIREVVKERAR